MYNANLLATIYTRNYNSIQAYLTDISNEESRYNPPAGNNLNWTLGHILASRNYIMPTLKQEAFWSEAAAAPYMWGSEKLAENKGLAFNVLLETFNESQELLIKSLESFSESDLHAGLAKGTVGQRLEFFAWHEGYHTGQLALLRRIVGKDITF